jgi:hypothetical protein
VNSCTSITIEGTAVKRLVKSMEVKKQFQLHTIIIGGQKGLVEEKTCVSQT